MVCMTHRWRKRDSNRQSRSTVGSAQRVRKKSSARRGAEEFICCQGEHGSKGAKRYLIGVSAPSAPAGFGRVRPVEQLPISHHFEGVVLNRKVESA
jgi:hypothetical protein